MCNTEQTVRMNFSTGRLKAADEDPEKRTVYQALPFLILFTESLNERLAVRIEEFLASLLPRRLEFGLCDVPVRPAFFGYGTQVLTKIFQSRPTPEPIAVIDLINDEAGFKNNRGGDHGIVERISVFGDI